jgi:hypothetical protein
MSTRPDTLQHAGSAAEDTTIAKRFGIHVIVYQHHQQPLHMQGMRSFRCRSKVDMQSSSSRRLQQPVEMTQHACCLGRPAFYEQVT